MLDSDSFIDLSDEERFDHAHASSSRRTPKSPHSFSSSPPWPPSPTSFDTLTPQEQAEEERRRKREKLAKLHRFLGSKVPTSLVLGIDEPALPEPAEPASSPSASESEARAWRKLRRRSSSAAELKGAWTDRVREDLDEREKAINVRRAIKMEKVSGRNACCACVGYSYVSNGNLTGICVSMTVSRLGLWRAAPADAISYAAYPACCGSPFRRVAVTHA